METSAKIAQLKSLWKICFGDTDEFIDFFFNRCYQSEESVFIEKAGTIVAALYIFPHPIICNGKTFSAGYIYGVGTHPYHRKQGYMKQLMLQAHQLMRERGMQMSMLIPAEEWLWSCYAKFGYLPAFNYSLVTCRKPTENLDSITVVPLKYFFLDVYEFFTHKTSERNCCVLHNAKDFAINIESHNTPNSAVFAAYREEMPEGVLFCLFKAGTLYVREAVYQNQAVWNTLLDAACRRFGVEEATCYIQPSDNLFPLGMACPLAPDFDFRAFLAQKPYMSLMMDE